MDTASCTSTLTESIPFTHDAGESNPSSDVISGGQSGRLDARSSTTLIRSPSSTATFTNLPDFVAAMVLDHEQSRRRDLETIDSAGMDAAVPHTRSPLPLRHTPR